MATRDATAHRGKALRLIGAIDIGGTKMSAGIVREDGVILTRRDCPTDPAQGFSAAMQAVCQLLAAQVPQGEQLCGLGVACPGPLNAESGIISEVGTLVGWQGGNLKTELGARFPVPIAVENDADAAALAEWAWGSGSEQGSMIYVTISTGIGGGIVIAGQLYRGVEGAHPELGHQVLDATGPLCYCGAHGCWESLASGSAMEAWMRQQDTSATRTTAAEICAAAEQGDALAIECVKREAYYLGLGLANLVTLFAPRTIALGGGVMQSSHLFLERAQAVVRRTSTQVPAEKTTIRLATLGQDTGLLGAARAWLTSNA